MRVLVTGVGGFVGPHLVRAIASRGDRAMGVGLESSAPATIASEPGFERYESWDLTRPIDRCPKILSEGVDAVVHLAGQASAARSFEDPETTFAANALGTLHLLESLRRSTFPGPVLVVSSSEIYGHPKERRPIPEDTAPRPVSPYGASKAAAESLAMTYASAFGMRVVIARSFSHTGPGQSPPFAVASWAQQIAGFEGAPARGESGPWRLRVGNLAPVRDYTDVRDVVSAYLLLLERGRPGEVYNVCTGKARSLAEVVHSLVALARVPVEIQEDPGRMRAADIEYLVGDPSRLREATGWEPAIPFEETLRALLEDARARAGTPAWETS